MAKLCYDGIVNMFLKACGDDGGRRLLCGSFWMDGTGWWFVGMGIPCIMFVGFYVIIVYVRYGLNFFSSLCACDASVRVDEMRYKGVPR